MYSKINLAPQRLYEALLYSTYYLLQKKSVGPFTQCEQPGSISGVVNWHQRVGAGSRGRNQINNIG